MEDQKIYQEVLKVAKKRILENFLRLDFDEVINEAYIMVYESKKPITSVNLTHAVNQFVKSYKLSRNTEWNEKQVNSTESKFCKSCMEDKPVACFGVTVRKATDKKEIQAYCHECLSKKMKEKRNLKPRVYFQYPEHLTTEKEKKAYYHRVWQKKNKEKVGIIKSRYSLKKAA